MHPAYFETFFDPHDFAGEWPVRFAIITAWATTGTNRPLAENDAADHQLKQEISRCGFWHQKVTGYCPKTNQAGRLNCHSALPVIWGTFSSRTPSILSMMISFMYRTATSAGNQCSSGDFGIGSAQDR
jgi:hypothetical protein